MRGQMDKFERSILTQFRNQKKAEGKTQKIALTKSTGKTQKTKHADIDQWGALGNRTESMAEFVKNNGHGYLNSKVSKFENKFSQIYKFFKNLSFFKLFKNFQKSKFIKTAYL